MDGSGMGYEIDIPYFENRTGKNNFQPYFYHVDYNLYEYSEQCISDASGVDLKEDNFMVGVILAAKAITQSIFNCFIGLTQINCNDSTVAPKPYVGSMPNIFKGSGSIYSGV